MQSSHLQFWIFGASILLCLLSSKSGVAEIVPDQTLPNNSSVTINGSVFNITGGTQAGRNLFHSFQQFSVPTGGTASFNNGLDIQNIISRVTGGSASNIDGLIKASATANLFFINPKGITFGPNASLQIGGSFVASTANSLKFVDGTQFSATAPQASPLLTISVPLGLQFGSNPGEIVNQSQASLNGAVNTIGSPVGLQVPNGKTLALVGGNISLTGGNLTALGGRIELGSVVGSGFVNLNEIETGYALNYADVKDFGNIQISKGTLADTSGEGGGAIQIQGSRINITDNSQIFSITQSKTGRDLAVYATDSVKLSGGSNIATLTQGEGRAGNVLVEASNSVELEGVAPDNSFSAIGSQVLQNATGNGGDVTINTRQLLIQNGARIEASTFGAGRAGDVLVKASDSVELIGADPDGKETSGIFTQVAQGATGDAGNLTIETKRITALNGGQISNATFFGGNAGILTINASDSIQLSGASPAATRNVYRSGIFVSAEQGATGDAGELNITTGQLTVENKAEISADNFGPGNGGTATINVRQLMIRDGGEVRASSFASGTGGDLIVNAAESVNLSGSGTIDSETFPSALSTSASAIGKAGNLNITTPSLKVQNGAEVTVSGEGSGPAGNLTIITNDLRLDRGRLTAETKAGEGATITLQNLDLLLLQNQSLISAQAFNNAKGGNINIDAAKGVVAAVSDQNNDIIANAFEGQGGKITITTQGIFGIAERKSTPPNTTNDIDASSDFGLAGTVTINTPDVDPSRSLFTLSTGVVDVSKRVASKCAAFSDEGGNSFTVTGRGGLPPSPDEPLTSDVVWSDTRLPNIGSGGNLRSSTTTPQVPPQTSDGVAIVPATGWVFNKDKGEVTLIARSPSATSNRLDSTPVSCPRH